MKIRFIVIFTLVLFASKASSQNTGTVEPSIFGVQAGFLGFWVNNETKLLSRLSLKSELGIEGGFLAGSSDTKFGSVAVPVLAVEPRFYYNIQKLAAKNRNTRNNNANFLALNIKYQPDFLITSNDRVNAISNISFIPKWSIRRSVGDHFHYEAGFGLGYRYFLETVNQDKGETAVDLHLRIGYNFKL